MSQEINIEWYPNVKLVKAIESNQCDSIYLAKLGEDGRYTYLRRDDGKWDKACIHGWFTSVAAALVALRGTLPVTDATPRPGAIARCSRDLVGIIVSAAPQKVIYPDGKAGEAWVGCQLHTHAYEYPNEKRKGRIAAGGDWSSRKPVVIGHIDDPQLTTVREVLCKLMTDYAADQPQA